MKKIHWHDEAELQKRIVRAGRDWWLKNKDWAVSKDLSDFLKSQIKKEKRKLSQKHRWS